MYKVNANISLCETVNVNSVLTRTALYLAYCWHHGDCRDEEKAKALAVEQWRAFIVLAEDYLVELLRLDMDTFRSCLSEQERTLAVICRQLAAVPRQPPLN